MEEEIRETTVERKFFFRVFDSWWQGFFFLVEKEKEVGGFLEVS